MRRISARSASEIGRAGWQTPPRLIPSADPCPESGSPWDLSIIVLRSPAVRSRLTRTGGVSPLTAERARQENVGQRQLPDLRMQDLDVDRRSRGLGALAENRSGALQELAAPLRDLVRMHVELPGQLRQRLLAPDGRYRHPIVGKTMHWIVF